MTHEETLKLEPGPKLDRLVAERVMGWEFDLLRDAWFKDGEGEIWAENWHPSTDIAAAWKVVKALREKGSVIDILSCPEDFTVKIWNENESEGLSIAKASAEQMPLAICRAALLAMMEARDEQ